MASEKKLYKKTSEKKICGVCAGLAEYLNMDVTVVRLLFVLLSLFTTGFPGILVYVIMALLCPMRTIFSPLMTTARNSNKYLALRFCAGELFTAKNSAKTQKTLP